MKTAIIVLALCLVPGIESLGQDEMPSTPYDKMEVQALESKIDTLVKGYRKLDIFSGVILVAEKGKPFYHKAFGMANREENIPNTIHTLFDIGSMNKTFTSVVVKQLIAEGHLKGNDKLTRFVSGFTDPRAGEITIRHLLEHRSGFGDYHDEDYFEAPKREKTLEAITGRAKKMALMFPPGTDQAYSNTGYVLLGAVIEKVTGKSYFENGRERCVKPLGLQNTFLENLEQHAHRVARGYLYTPLGSLERNDALQDLPNPDGGFLSTTLDIMKFYRSYYYDTLLLSKETKLKDPSFRSLNTLPPGKATGEAGGFEGFNTALYQIISDDITIIVFANMDEPVAEQMARGILQIIRGETPEKAKLPAIQNVRVHFESSGIDYVKEHFDNLTTNYHPADPRDWILNDLGYAYLYGKNDVDKAIELFRLNTKLFPRVANSWDSLGEALLAKGDTARALAAYQKALKLDPGLESAIERLKEVK